MKMDKSLTELLQMIGKLDEAPLSVVSDAVGAREDELVRRKLLEFPIGSRVIGGDGNSGVVIGRNKNTLQVVPDNADVDKASPVNPDAVDIISNDENPEEVTQ